MLIFQHKNNPQFEQPPPKKNNFSNFRPQKVTRASLSNFFECPPPELHSPHKNMETLEKSHIMQWEKPISKMLKSYNTDERR